MKNLRIGLGLLMVVTMLVACAGGDINSPLSRAEKRIYRLDTLSIEPASSLPDKTIAGDIERELGEGWRFWLFGYRPLDVVVQIHDISVPSSYVQRLFGTQSRMTTRIIIRDKQTNAVLDDFTRVTRGGYEGLSLNTDGQETQKEAQRLLAELFVKEFRVMFYFGLD